MLYIYYKQISPQTQTKAWSWFQRALKALKPYQAMKQKIIIRVTMHCDKCRKNAMKIAAEAQGVNSVELEGEEKDQLVVIGDGIDSVCLTKLLRKKVCRHATILSIGEVKGADKEKEKEKEKEKVEITQVAYYCPCPPCPMNCQVVYEDPYPCSIL